MYSSHHGLIDPQTRPFSERKPSCSNRRTRMPLSIAPDPVLSQTSIRNETQEPELSQRASNGGSRGICFNVQRRAGLLFILCFGVPDTTQEGAQTDLLIGLDDLDQALLFFGTHSLFGLEQHIASTGSGPNTFSLRFLIRRRRATPTSPDVARRSQN